MLNSLKVIAIVPTYNRSDKLIRCVSNLINQTYPVEKIIIVDNNSDDEHRKVLSKLNEEHYGKIEILNLNDNYGGAGGFEKGMIYARERFSPDFYWLMDDDAYPDSFCLEQLIYAFEKENLGALAPVVYGIDNKDYQMYHHKRVRGLFLKEEKVKEEYEKLNEVEEIDANAFVGVLVYKNVVEKIGYPDGSLFIYGDDFEYTLRITKVAKKKIYLVKKAIMYHNDVTSQQGGQAIFWWKKYYYIRNKLLILRKYTKKQINWLVLFLYTLTLWKVFAAALLKGNLSLKLRLLHLKLILRGVVDGFRNKRGKTLEPNSFIKIIQSFEKK